MVNVLVCDLVVSEFEIHCCYCILLLAKYFSQIYEPPHPQNLKYFSTVIIIIMSGHQHGYPWPSLDTFPNRSSLQGYIPYPHITAECMFELVVLLLPGHMWGSIRVHPSWARPLLLQHCPACLVRLTWIVLVIGGRWPYSWCLMGCCRQDLFDIARRCRIKWFKYCYVALVCMIIRKVMVSSWQTKEAEHTVHKQI